MTKIQKLKIIIPLAVFIPFLTAVPVFAAEVAIDSSSQKIGVGNQFEAGFFLNTDNEDINAVEGKIVFPEKLLKLKEIKDGNSIINFWIERPKAKNGEILFSGIIPGGYLGKKGLIFSVVFQSIQEGQGSIEIQDIKVLLNDGKGTAAKATGNDALVTVLPSSQIVILPPPQISESRDTDPPELFSPIVAQSEQIFNNKHFLAFATQDKGSGMDYYEVAESKKAVSPQEYNSLTWQKAESPYLLLDQKLRSFIYVKAIDKAGNQRIAIVPPRSSEKIYENKKFWVIIGLLLVLIITLSLKIWSKLFGKQK